MLTNLRAARIAAGMTTAQAAALLGVTQSVYSKFERGAVRLSADKALILCNRFKLDLESLLVVS
jgi:transcriptional regulator with XRE-family HTH domain